MWLRAFGRKSGNGGRAQDRSPILTVASQRRFSCAVFFVEQVESEDQTRSAKSS